MKQRRFRVVNVSLFLATGWLVLGASTASNLGRAQTVEFTVRPTWESSVVLVGNPGNARDDSPSSAAGGSWGRVCRDNCTDPVEATATWEQVPGGYRPLRLEVKWRASNVMALYGNDTAEVSALLEYDLGTGWNVLAWYLWNASSPVCPSPSNGTITCPDHVDVLTLSPNQRTDFIRVRVTEKIRLTHCDNCWIRVSNVSGGLSVYDIAIKADDCFLPSGESTSSRGFGGPYPNPSPANETRGRFYQTLIPETPGVIFDRRRVVEVDPGGGGPDTCWRSGDNVDPFDAVDGSSWIVSAANGWGDDYIGYWASVVASYRTSGRAPCGTSFPQAMYIYCGSTPVRYTTHTVEAGFDDTIVWSRRAGSSQSRVWP